MFIESNDNWDFLNRSSQSNCSVLDCRAALMDAKKCPTNLTIISLELKTVPRNLLAICFPRFKLLTMQSCGIEEISRNSFAYAYNLIELDLSANRISKLSNHTFELLPKVEIINLSSNRIGVDGIEAFAFEKCKSLKTLVITNNDFTHISETKKWLIPLKNLEVLEIGNSQMNFDFAISDFYNNTNLVSLYAIYSRTVFDGSEYSNISTYFPKMKHLIVFRIRQGDKYQTNMSKYFMETYYHDTNLSIFDTSGKYLTHLGIPYNFKVVIANHNFIRNLICPAINPVVTELYLNNNELTNVDIVQKLPNLEIADFSSNNLHYINEAQFLNLAHLVELNLANNQLREIDSGILERIPTLKVLDISFNSYKDFYELTRNPVVQYIAVSSSFNIFHSTVQMLSNAFSFIF